MSNDVRGVPNRSPLVGIVLLLLGAALVLAAFGIVRTNPDAWRVSPAVIGVIGLLLGACGVLAGRWIPANSVLNDVFGASIFTAMAFLGVWIAVYGLESGFRGSATIGGAGASTSTGAARALFAVGGVATALIAAVVWWRVVRRVFCR